MKQIIFIFIFSGWFVFLFAQNQETNSSSVSSCSTFQEDAKSAFQNGLFLKSISDLEWSLMNCKLTKSEKKDAYELLAKSYIELDQTEKADSIIEILLKKNPHYELKEDNHSEGFNRMMKKYRIHPKLTIGIRNSLNTLQYRTTKIYSVLPGVDYKAKYNHQGSAFFYYGLAEYEFIKNTSLNIEGIFFWSSYNRVIQKNPSFNLYYYEKDNFLEIPVYFKQYIRVTKNLIPYISYGLAWLRILDASANVSISYTTGDNLTTGHNYDYTAFNNNIDVKSMRNVNNLEWILGAGIGYQFKNLKLFLDVRYFEGLTNITNANKRYNNDRLVNDFYYIDNTVKIDQFEFGATIAYTLKNSIKKKR